MSINVSVGFQIPTNVVEVGNEISTQQLGAITSGSSPTSANPFTTVSYVSGLYATKASPTFTGTVTIPSGASISGYLTTSSASSTYQTISGMSSYATQSYVTSQGYLTDAPSDGSEYVRKNATWAVATGGGGGGISDAPSDGNLYARQNASWTSFTVPTLSVTNIDLTGNFNGYSMGSGNYTFKFDSTANTLRMQNGSGSGITISATAITFPDATMLSTAPTVAKTVYSVGSGGHTFVAGDANNILYVPNDIYYSTITISVPTDSTYNFAVGTMIDLCFNVDSTSSIQISTTGAGSPTLLGNTGSISGNQVGRRTFIKLAADLWLIS